MQKPSGRGDCVSDARANLDDTLGRVGHYHLEKGDLTSAYLAFKRLATKEDGTIDHGRSLSLAQVCERLKFHDEAEQLYRGYYGQNEIKGSDYWYTSHQRDALKGITRCLVKRGKLSEAKELGIQLKGLGALNHPIIGSWGYGLWAPRNKDKVDTIHHVLRNTISNHEHLEFVDLPVTLS